LLSLVDIEGLNEGTALEKVFPAFMSNGADEAIVRVPRKISVLVFGKKRRADWARSARLRPTPELVRDTKILKQNWLRI
jgi:hypothetical protein